MAALALEFLILTGTGTGETLGATWREIDPNNAIWTIPPDRMKTGDAFSVPLSDRARRAGILRPCEIRQMNSLDLLEGVASWAAA